VGWSLGLKQESVNRTVAIVPGHSRRRQVGAALLAEASRHGAPAARARDSGV